VRAVVRGAAPTRFESSVVIGHAFWREDNVRDRSRVGWWGAALAAVRAAVMRDDADALVWRDVTKAVGTPVREGAACVHPPQY
jgi:hypothetical protein